MVKTSIGLEENITGLLCYVLGWVSGLVLLLLETKNKFVRFHAIQSICVFGTLTVAGIIINAAFGWIPVLGTLLSSLIGLLAFILWIVLMIKAYQGQRFKLPWAGNFAEKRAG